MTDAGPSVNQTICRISQINYSLPTTVCDHCGQAAPYFTAAERMAIDLDLDHPVLLHITVSVHQCANCRHYFRAQPPFLRRDAIYTNRVVDKVVQSVYQDSMAMRQVTARMARDFWVRPGESTIRGWCRSYSAGFDFETDYQPWVVGQFSGILCVDEVYQDRLALLLAVDPAAPDGDRMIGYQLVHGDVDAMDVERFLANLKRAGVEPNEVVTDGSKLYPAVLVKVWPKAAHQLCLFHETRHVTRAVMKVINSVRKNLPHPPPAPGVRGGGPLRNHPPSHDPSDPATQRWHWRQMQRYAHIAHVHDLSQQGLSQRAIARQTGHHRRTIRRWLRQPVPLCPENLPAQVAQSASLSLPFQRRAKKQGLRQQVHRLAQEGLSHSAIARQVGIHRVTVKRWLTQAPPSSEVEAPATPEKGSELTPPPALWSDWDEVRQVREMLHEHRFLLLRRPENLNPEEQTLVTSMLASPSGADLQVARSFLVDWYRLWTDEDGRRRSLDDARARYDAWRTNSSYRTLPSLRHIQEQMTQAKFEHLSQFLRYPEWEATNNGAERAGRAFRHRQAPHFNLRKKDYIEDAINVAAGLRKEAATRPPPQPFHTCQRGRNRRPESDMPATMLLTAVPTDTISLLIDTMVT